MSRTRQLPDGTHLDEVTGVVSAPLVDSPRPSATAGPATPRYAKRFPSPPAGPGPTIWAPSPPGIGETTPARKFVATVLIVGVCATTVWWQNRRKKRKQA